MIHVCFGLHDADGKYSKFAGTTMASIFENTSAPVTVHILHDATLTDENRENFAYLAGFYSQRVKFHNVERLCASEINFLRTNLAEKINLRFSIGAFYRLLIKKILAPHKIDKAIYLDADIIVNLDIAELWRHDVKNFPLAAVPESAATFNDMITNKFLLNSALVSKENYFCSGVIMFNLDKIDEKFFRDGVQFLIDNPACESPDQDILNAFFAKNYLKLAQKFDSFVVAERQLKLSVAKKIYHYAGRSIELKLNDEFNRLFMEYFSRTPWFNVEILGRIGENFRRGNDEYALIIQRLIKSCVEQRRTFFVGEKNVPAIKNLFSISENEPIIFANDENSVDNLVEKMRENRFAIICRRNYNQIKRKLLNLGFREFVDFVNGMSFMTREQCGYTRPEWPLIRGM